MFGALGFGEGGKGAGARRGAAQQSYVFKRFPTEGNVVKILVFYLGFKRYLNSAA